MSYNFKDFALLQGQIVQILDVKYIRPTKFHELRTNVKIKLVGDTHTHWVDIKSLQPLKDQTAAKILFNKKSA